MRQLRPDDPQWIGRFRVEAALGAGGMGRVYLASGPDGRLAAVKVIREELAEDTGFRHRFHREVSAALSVAGMFTARVLDADPDADVPWLATEYVEGPSLREAVERFGPMTGAAPIELARGLAEALGSIHAAGLVHRDLKPANVLLAATGPKVIDFGIAWSAASTQLTGTGQMVGSPAYMAPEQIAGTSTGPAVDVFALGSTLCYATTSRNPFAADQTAITLYRIMQQEPDLSGLPDELSGLVRSCLAKSPGARPTAVQIATALRTDRGLMSFDPAVDRSGPTGPHPAPAPPAGPTPAARTSGSPGGTGRSAAAPSAGRRRRILVTSAGAVLALIAATAAGFALATGGEAAAEDVVTYTRAWCRAGQLVGVSDVAGAYGEAIATTRDPAVLLAALRRDVDRLQELADASAAELTVLRDDAPTPAAAAEFGRVLASLDAVDGSIAAARTAADSVDVTDPDGAGISEVLLPYSSGASVVVDATQRVRGVPLPAEYLDVAAATPNCAR